MFVFVFFLFFGLRGTKEPGKSGSMGVDDTRGDLSLASAPTYSLYVIPVRAWLLALRER